MDHQEIQDLIPAYALGAADPDERQAVESHLPSCAACRAQLSDYRRLGDEMLYAAPIMTAPAGLTEHMRLQVTPPPSKDTPGPWWTRLRLRTVAPVLGALILLLAISNLYWVGRVNRLERQAAEQAGVLARLANAPAISLTADAPAAYAQGVVYAPPDGKLALLCVYDMPELPAGKAYQLWLIKDGQRENGGVFRVSNDGFGLLVIHPDRPLSEYSAVGITIEPAAGSPAPTSPRVLGASLEKL